MYIKYYRLTIVSRCVAKEVQRNAKWGYLRWKRRVGEVEKESGRGGRREWARWEKRVGEAERESE